LLPADVRPHVAAVYAFARTADDIADEGGNTTPAARVAALDAMERSLLACKDGSVSHDDLLFTALADTIALYALPLQPFHDLLTAFRMDAVFRPPQTWDEVLAYCRFSANPVGEIILRLFNEYNPTTAAASDAVCTALQLTNFWQDLSRDLPVGRRYLPPDVSLDEALERTQQLFARGADIDRYIRHRRLRWELRLIVLAGSTVLQRCIRHKHELTTYRPALRSTDYLALLGNLVFGGRTISNA
jgi:phytoene/squalene synthetase